MSTAPTTRLIQRNDATMQITIDDDGVHLDITRRPLVDTNTVTGYPTALQISLTFDEAISLGELLVKLKDESHGQAQNEVNA